MSNGCAVESEVPQIVNLTCSSFHFLEKPSELGQFFELQPERLELERKWNFHPSVWMEFFLTSRYSDGEPLVTYTDKYTRFFKRKTKKRKIGAFIQNLESFIAENF